MRTTPPSHCVLTLWVALALLYGCAYEFEDFSPRPHGSVGSEVFRIVCMNLAAQAFPNDLTGERFSAECDGQDAERRDAGPEAQSLPETAQAERAYFRQRALLVQRPRLVSALDAAFDERGYRKDELRTFLANMVPLYDAPEELPVLTRAVAALLTRLVDPKDDVGAGAIAALERMSAREGYRPARFDLGLTRSMLTHPELDEVLRTTLSAIAADTGPAKDAFEDLLRASALDLATAERGIPDPKHPGTLSVSTKLLFSEDDTFAGKGTPIYLTLRDARGVARPSSASGGIQAPFKDDDGDGLADIDERGRFVFSQGGFVPPYPVFASAIPKQSSRDTLGRALDANKTPVYASVDANRTLLAGVLRDSREMLTANSGKRAPLLDYVHGLNAVLGDYGPRTHIFGKAKFNFQGPDTTTGPVFDLVHALSSLLPFEQTDQFLQVVEQLLRDHQVEVAGLVEAILYIKERSDAYPDAAWNKPHEFWDDLIAWSAHVAATPGVMERLLRAMAEADAAKLGPLVGNFMRFKDRVNYPLGKREELKALGIDPVAVIGNLKKPCSGTRCGQPCDLTNPCGVDAACVVNAQGKLPGTCGAIWEAVQAHRINVNAPCQNPPPGMFAIVLGQPAGTVGDPECKPMAPYPAAHHRGIRGCPADKPEEGASCSDAGGLGLCSWDAGSCTCACAGGLCRHGAQPTWSCTNKPTKGFAEWVDRAQADNRAGTDGHSNQSLFQRTIALVHDLHVPTEMCNKEQAAVALADPAGSASVLANGAMNTLLGALGSDLLGPFPKCAMLKEDHIVRYYLRSALGYGGVEIKHEALKGFMDLLGTAGDPVMESQYQIRGFNLGSPTPQGIGRMVFSPQNPFQDGVTGLVVSRDNKFIVDLHQDTIMSWELPDPIGGKSYLEALVPILKALDPNKDTDEGHIDLFADVFSILHKHWSSRNTDATQRVCDDAMPPSCDEKVERFAFQSNGVSYEELAAEAFLDAKIIERMHDLMVVLAATKTTEGKDGIQVLAEALLNLLIPEKSCVGGDCAAHPLAYRDGKTTSVTNTGKPVANVAPIYLLLDALNAIDARFEGSLKDRLVPWRAGRSKLVDVFFDVTADAPGQWRFTNPRGPALLLSTVGFLRERLTVYRTEQAECAAGGGTIEACQQLREWTVGLTRRLEASLGQPVSAATLRLLDRFRELDSDPAGKLAELMRHIATESDKDSSFAGAVMGTADLLQTLADTRSVGALMTFVSRALAPNANDVAAGTAKDLDIQSSSVQKALKLMRSLQEVSPEVERGPSTLATLLSRLARPYDADGATPLDVIIDSVVFVNRATPGEREETPLEAQDLRLLLRETEQFLSSERHGLERLYDVIQSRILP